MTGQQLEDFKQNTRQRMNRLLEASSRHDEDLNFHGLTAINNMISQLLSTQDLDPVTQDAIEGALNYAGHLASRFPIIILVNDFPAGSYNGVHTFNTMAAVTNFFNTLDGLTTDQRQKTSIGRTRGLVEMQHEGRNMKVFSIIFS
jgi:hypothetical protein